jgi:TRAP-type transport system periplasmic protein
MQDVVKSIDQKEGIMRSIYKINFIALLVFAVVCMFSTVGSTQDKVITLRYSDQFPAGDVHTKLDQEYCKEIEKRTNGKVKITLYPGSTLNTTLQMYDAVVQGTADMSNSVPVYQKGRFLLMEGLGDTPFEYLNSHQSSQIANLAYEKFRPKEFDDVKVMYFHMTPEAVLHTVKKPILKCDDLKDMRIRSQGGNEFIIKSFGGVVVAMPQSDTYDALSKGILGGISAVQSGLQTWKTADILRYTTELRGTAQTALFVVSMNKDKWNSIPPEHQKVIEQINKEWILKQGKQWDDIEKEGREYCISRGMKITKLSAEEQAKWNKAAEPLFADYVKRTKEKGLPGEEFLAFVREQLKKVK